LVGQILFIEAFFDTSDIILITAPSRIGKSSNMKMLKTFLEIVMDKNENAIHNTMKKSCEFVENYKIFKDNQLNTYVEEKKFFFKEHCRRYPLIYVDFQAAHDPTYKAICCGCYGLWGLSGVGKQPQKL
jgi:hypothetical protein